LRFPVVFLRPSRHMLTNIWSHDCSLHKHHKLIYKNQSTIRRYTAGGFE